VAQPFLAARFCYQNWNAGKHYGQVQPHYFKTP
jgi:hypothetical protein